MNRIHDGYSAGFQVKHAAVMFCSLVPSSLGFESNEEEFKSLNQVRSKECEVRS